MSHPDLLRGAVEARLLEVERQTNAMGQALRRIALDQTGIQQQLWEDAGTVRRRGTATPTPTPTPNTTFSGSVVSICSGTAVDATLVITNAGTGATLWTGSATIAGGYSGSLYIATNTSVTLTATGTHARMGVGTLTVTLTAGTSNSIANVSCQPASGYHCAFGCKYPLGGTINVVNHRKGTTVACTWDGIDRWTTTELTPDGLATENIGYVPGANVFGTTFITCVQNSLACWDGVTTFAAQYRATNSAHGYLIGDLFDLSE